MSISAAKYFRSVTTWRRPALLTAFFSAMVGLSLLATPPAQACPKGCDCTGVLETMKTHSEVNSILDKSMGIQIKKQNDNAQGMTCFDRALAQTARLGQMFSDVLPAGNIPGQVSSVFGTSSFPNLGIDKPLVSGMGNVLGDALTAHAGNFTQSLSNALGATIMGGFKTLANGINTMLADTGVTSALSALGSVVGDINAAYSTLQGAMNLLHIPLPMAVSAALSTLNGYWSTIQGAINAATNAAVSALKTAINAVMAPIKSGINGMLGGAFPPGSGPCDRLQQLWGNGNPIGVIGNSIEKTVPYVRMGDLVRAAAVDGNFTSIPGIGAEMEKKLTGTKHISTMTKAYDDLNIGGPLHRPGTLPSWKPLPTLSPTATIVDVIGAM